MKLRKVLFTMSVPALMFLAAGCNSSDNENEVNPVQLAVPGALQIELAGNELIQSRALAANYDDESKILKYNVYVFNNQTDLLERLHQQTGDGVATIENLSTGTPKRLVVLTNLPDGFPVLVEGDPYSKLTDATAAIPISEQSPAKVIANGMVMYGSKSPVILSSTEVNREELTVTRVAAKVTLRFLKIAPKQGYTGDFKLTGVSMQRVPSHATIEGVPLGVGAENKIQLVGGIVKGEAEDISEIQHDFLIDNFTTPYTVYNTTGSERGVTIGNYFYVLPYTDPDSCILMTLVGEYDGNTIYYPIRVNHNHAMEQFKYVRSNTSYIVDVTMNDVANGSEHPDITSDRVDLEVTIKVSGWFAATQTEVW